MDKRQLICFFLFIIPKVPGIPLCRALVCKIIGDSIEEGMVYFVPFSVLPGRTHPLLTANYNFQNKHQKLTFKL